MAEKDKIQESDNIQESQDQDDKEYKVKYISGMYKTWFIDYASYVILERAVSINRLSLRVGC